MSFRNLLWPPSYRHESAILAIKHQIDFYKKQWVRSPVSERVSNLKDADIFCNKTALHVRMPIFMHVWQTWTIGKMISSTRQYLGGRVMTNKLNSFTLGYQSTNPEHSGKCRKYNIVHREQYCLIWFTNHFKTVQKLQIYCKIRDTFRRQEITRSFLAQ